ncbi:MAG: 1-deoxy-D-xylulose-5-phosphate synthase [Candidatus Kapaibacterium sp.]|nr:1-deoxy-D-xylulose-5-phosphate synthase [Ignavibacteria bacterium]QOJ27113.1 MAG: 1-deoxy-D-xylulose-5-phosphate synthase [Ignavibacteria bacterium]WKZ78294.1 MAG: 1-deoxy-D-xylulose-5-phosphate synthase [Candidatus Kapabacteria bacterium]
MKYLNSINSPADLRQLAPSQLRDVADEVRQHLIDTITKVGGHFGAGLGAVELTVALHYVYNTPIDKIVWDTGHQAYPHKILTGRRDSLHTIRQKGGISGFLKRSESEFDTFGAGHATTSISAALGMAAARDVLKENYKVVAVIGDGAMTGGMAYEAMNNCGVLKSNMLVVLNDNQMSIAPNVWALSNYFSEIFATPRVQNLRQKIVRFTEGMENLGDRIRQTAHRLEGGFKAVLTPGMLFEALGFQYFGPVNGHNIDQLVKMLTHIREINGPVLLHTITQKGKGYAPAEKDKQFLHAIGKLPSQAAAPAGGSEKPKPKPPTYQTVFGNAMVELMSSNPKIVGITAAMPDGTGLDIVQKQFADKVYDVGIAEEHAVTFAAGMATQGVTPVVAVYSSFLQRAFDQIMHDVALQHLHVVFAMDRAGVVGADGPTHHGVLDLGYMRLIQGMVVMAPKDEQELRDMLYTAIHSYTSGPISIRYPRGEGEGVPLRPFTSLPIGKSEILRSGTDVALIAIGNRVYPALQAAEQLAHSGIEAEVINARFAKPLDTAMLQDIAGRIGKIITIEDGQMQGGFGSAVAEFLSEHHPDTDLQIHGYPDVFSDHGTQQELWAEYKLDADGIEWVVKNFLSEKFVRELR